MFDEIPDFLKRPYDPNAKRIITRRRTEKKIPYPREGYGCKQKRILPKTMSTEAWAILKEQERMAEQKKKERLEMLKQLKR
jgi:thiamine kinase-like enzyme